jgi:hypothetical protein
MATSAAFCSIYNIAYLLPLYRKLRDWRLEMRWVKKDAESDAEYLLYATIPSAFSQIVTRGLKEDNTGFICHEPRPVARDPVTGRYMKAD